MATFEYEALDPSGRNKRGVITADSPREARQSLRQQQLTPVRLSNARDRKTSERSLSNYQLRDRSAGHLSSKELVLVTRQISTLVETAVPLEEALGAVAEQAENDKVCRIILGTRDRILEGWRFADALGENEKSFPALYRAVISAGEASGDLGGVMERLATMLEKNRAIRNKAISSLIYPIVLLLVSLIIVGLMMRFVVPKIVTQFEDFNAELPFLTRMVIAISDGLRDYGLVILVALAAIIGLCVYLWRQAGPRLGIDRWLLSIPFIGKLLRGLDGARFARTLATLFAGGAPLIDALTGAQRTIMNSHIRDQLDITITMVREGAGLSRGLKKANALPPMMTHMVAAGEKSGELPKLLDKTAAHLEDEFETATSVALRLLEPLIVVFMGIIVMTIVLSILLPTLRLNTLAAGG